MMRSPRVDMWAWWAELQWRWLEYHWRECLQCAMSAGELPLADELCPFGQRLVSGYITLALDDDERR